MSMSSSFRSGRKHKLKAEINVVPFIDVMLVLLIIFMITAPLIQQGVKVNLTKTSEGQSEKLDQTKSLAVIITVDADNQYYLKGTTPVSIEEVEAVIKAQREKSTKEVKVVIRGDTVAQYGKIIELLGRLKKDGIGDAGLMTDPYSSEKR